VSALLGRVPLFEGLTEADLGAIAGIVKPLKAAAGDVLFREGEVGDAFYVVTGGSVEIVKRRSDGEEEKFAVRRAGEAFGEMALLNDAPRSATARAVGSAALLVIERGAFEELMGPGTPAFRMMGSLARSLRALDIRFTAQERAAFDGGGPAGMSRLLQRGLLPRNAPSVPGYEIAAGTSLPEEGRGGSIWDAFPVRGGRMALAVLNVPGDGLPAAYHLGVARAALRSAARTEEKSGAILSRANEVLADTRIPGADQFVECGMLVAGESGAEWSSAGLCPGAVLPREGGSEALPSGSPPLGFDRDSEYGSMSVSVAPGASVLILSEASRGLFRGAVDLVRSMGDRPAGDAVGALHGAVAKAAKDAPGEISVILMRGR
jgi:CRP-like cAMP-binding protein